EYLDEFAPYNLSLLLRVGGPGERSEEASGGVDAIDLDAEIAGEGPHDFLRLVLSEQAGVDEDAAQPVADRAVDQRGGHRRVDSAREPEQHLLLPDLAPDLLHRLFEIAGHVPVPAAAADLVHEAA